MAFYVKLLQDVGERCNSFCDHIKDGCAFLFYLQSFLEGQHVWMPHL